MLKIDLYPNFLDAVSSPYRMFGFLISYKIRDLINANKEQLKTLTLEERDSLNIEIETYEKVLTIIDNYIY